MAVATRNLGAIMGHALNDAPDRLAVIDLSASPPVTLTYGQLDDALARVAGVARGAGLVPGDRVAVAVANRIEFVLAVFGLMRAGVVPAPVNVRLPAADLAAIAADSGCIGLVADASLDATAVAEAAGLRLRIGVGRAQADWPELRDLMRAAEPVAPTEPAADDPSLLLFTSGSTGRPKGVLMSHGGQLRSFSDQLGFYRAILAGPPVNLIAVPLFHKNGTGMLKTTFALGGTAVLMPRFDARAFLQAIQAHRVTMFAAVAAMLAMMLRERDLVRDLDLASLQAIFCGAAPTGAVLLDEVSEALGARVFHMYGTTESGATMGSDPARRVTLDSCGRPLPGVQVQLADSDGRAADEGELWVRAPGLALGYVNRPADHAARFRDGWYRTGDILWRDSAGDYFFRGRTDDMFVCGGENIYPVEVERVLLGHPAILQASVVAVPHPLKGAAPAAALVTAPGAALDAEQVRAWFVANGPAYAHPRSVILLDAMPLAPTGKIDRTAVRAMFDPQATA